MNGRAEVPLETDKKSAFGVGQFLGACAAVVVLLAAVALAAEATPPGANGKLVYNSVNPTTFVEGIFLTNPDGSASEQITQGRDFFPVWSPDGNRVAFLRWS